MRVVARKAFLALPAGTIYCKGKQWAFESICLKGDSLENDWIFLDPSWPSIAKESGEAFHTLDKALSDGSSFDANNDYSRDGCFDDDDVFLIFEKPDLSALRNKIDIAFGLT